MKRALLPVCLLVLAAAHAPAQQQEQGLLERIDAKRDLAIKAMDGKSKSNPALSSSLSNQSFEAKSATMKTFNTSKFGGVKSASLKTYETHYFLGVKNPWFGKKVFDTYASRASDRAARESSREFETQAFAVRESDKARKQDLADASTALPVAAQPRPYLGPEQPNKQAGVEKFTQNLHKDLSIDDVRDLLNKGHGE